MAGDGTSLLRRRVCVNKPYGFDPHTFRVSFLRLQYQQHMEPCPSGLWYSPGKRVWDKTHREFESLRFRPMAL
jgi:hypothetical protein